LTLEGNSLDAGGGLGGMAIAAGATVMLPRVAGRSERRSSRYRPPRR
jgi:hypothetical protein